MFVSSIVPEKSRGNKKCDEEKSEEKTTHFCPFWHHCKTAVTWLYVHSVEDSTLMSIFDQFCFSVVFSGVAKMGPNRYT